MTHIRVMVFLKFSSSVAIYLGVVMLLTVFIAPTQEAKRAIMDCK